MKKLLITGSNGFVGNYFINNYKSKYNIKTFSFLKDDINSLDCSDVDVVFHLSALVHQMGGASSEEYERVNVIQTLQLAKKAKESGIKQFIFMSTVAVYGEEKEKLDENTICNPITPYGKSKLEAEKELLKLNDDSFIVSIIRPPMIYGKNAPGNIDSLVKLVKKLPIIPLGKIENKRSFISIQNLCFIINEIITQEKQGIFLASDDEPLSTSRLIELVAKNLDKKVYLVKIPFFESLLKILKPSFHKRLYGSLEIDNSITKEKLNLKNLYSVEDGVRLMIKGRD
ncbi:NAD-dependent epimerase/dehydratase family protein [Aliarcobacter butzleri]|uniref:NAD-dependent epimerase/dehydratase family protein n=1 Tax=Aliarcobacter butzleri TaxID=28197 RepID=UPI00126099A0|nr:NAD-dependent epimerase/dehydratase family protein [Aliarcobacter butzleri]